MAKKEIVSQRLEDDLIKTEKKLQEIDTPDEKSTPLIKSSKPISQIKKGNTIKVDSLVLEVDAHYVLIAHDTTKEMTIELFDTKTDKDYQLRYFSDQVENSVEFYELEEIVYVKREVKKIEW